MTGEDQRLAWALIQLLTITVGAAFLWGWAAAVFAFGLTHLIQERWQ